MTATQENYRSWNPVSGCQSRNSQKDEVEKLRAELIDGKKEAETLEEKLEGAKDQISDLKSSMSSTRQELAHAEHREKEYLWQLDACKNALTLARWLAEAGDDAPVSLREFLRMFLEALGTVMYNPDSEWAHEEGTFEESEELDDLLGNAVEEFAETENHVSTRPFAECKRDLEVILWPRTVPAMQEILDEVFHLDPADREPVYTPPSPPVNETVIPPTAGQGAKMPKNHRGKLIAIAEKQLGPRQHLSLSP
ncbi:MAG: hypothetical protein KAI66_21130 [Lentisphaeria bacterium]|nr:hypothetical protein [Lentisphaeria bacterium]